MSLKMDIARVRQELDDTIDPIVYELTKGDWYHQQILDDILKAADDYAHNVVMLFYNAATKAVKRASENG